MSAHLVRHVRASSMGPSGCLRRGLFGRTAFWLTKRFGGARTPLSALRARGAQTVCAPRARGLQAHTSAQQPPSPNPYFPSFPGRSQCSCEVQLMGINARSANAKYTQIFSLGLPPARRAAIPVATRAAAARCRRSLNARRVAEMRRPLRSCACHIRNWNMRPSSLCMSVTSRHFRTPLLSAHVGGHTPICGTQPARKHAHCSEACEFTLARSANSSMSYTCEHVCPWRWRRSTTKRTFRNKYGARERQ